MYEIEYFEYYSDAVNWLNRNRIRKEDVVAISGNRKDTIALVYYRERR